VRGTDWSTDRSRPFTEQSEVFLYLQIGSHISYPEMSSISINESNLQKIGNLKVPPYPLLREPKGSPIPPPFHAMLFVQDISYGLASLAPHTLLYRISFMGLFVGYTLQQGGLWGMYPPARRLWWMYPPARRGARGLWGMYPPGEPLGSLFFLP
jgi:hypothetical protein